MIKKSIYILCTSLALGCSACDDWLTVVPETTLIADNLLETDEGILQVLDGAYVLAASNVYKPTGYLGGGGCVEEMAKTWTKDNSSWANHEYDIDNSGVANTLDVMFMQIYKIINTLNPIIEACDKNKDKYREEYYNIVKEMFESDAAKKFFDTKLLIIILKKERLWHFVPACIWI